MADGEQTDTKGHMKQQIVVSVVAAIIVLIIAAIGGKISDGGLISILNGATQADLATIQRIPIPEGAVVAFDTPDGCPEGWSELPDVVGKVIIGAGRGNTYPYRVPGGKEYIDLTEEHIPAHVHGYTDTYFSESANHLPRGSKGVAAPGKKGLSGDVDTNNVGWAIPRETDPFGHEEENRIRHTNMQPYIALHFCVFKPSQ